MNEIEKLRDEKQELEVKILDMFVAFEQKYNISISSIGFDKLQMLSGKTLTSNIKLHIEV